MATRWYANTTDAPDVSPGVDAGWNETASLI